MDTSAFGLADFELYHSRPIAPTRRLALGLQYLPCQPAPGPGGLLLAGLVAHFAHELSEEDQGDAMLLMAQLEAGMRIVQPRVRHRLQADRVGLLKSHHRLEADVDGPRFVLSAGRGSPLVHTLGAMYAAANLPGSGRGPVFAVLRKAMRWRGPLDGAFVAQMSGEGGAPRSWRTVGSDPTEWALSVLGFESGTEPADRDIRRRFREELRTAHPDHGGDEGDAAERIAELGEARRILLGS